MNFQIDNRRRPPRIIAHPRCSFVAALQRTSTVQLWRSRTNPSSHFAVGSIAAAVPHFAVPLVSRRHSERSEESLFVFRGWFNRSGGLHARHLRFASCSTLRARSYRRVAMSNRALVIPKRAVRAIRSGSRCESRNLSSCAAAATIFPMRALLALGSAREPPIFSCRVPHFAVPLFHAVILSAAKNPSSHFAVGSFVAAGFTPAIFDLLRVPRSERVVTAESQ
jgi:hypothetical protein